MTKIIGLTGGIGSGKTTIAKYIQSLGIPVYIADDAAKKIMELPETISSIKQVFGSEVFENEKLSKEKLAKIVFNNSQNLKQLNQIVHPAVKRDFDEWFSKQKGFPFVVKEAAILFESGSYKDCDAIITVEAPLDTRIQRVIKRDNTNLESVMSRVNNQWTDEMRATKSDYVVENVDIKKAMLQIDEILKKMTNQ
ncbi:dephospho-CoA kinase [Flavobacterium sp.]|uniref:dephospho-CoA kinase n=1 Tax=Flavobacterium sp. TaxID=239 RepID=UPI002B4B85A2|nr:dephospho-CoA kinase [Flavobacterium sp.]HLF51772.1 dephospho-CoA kinase [Flavobacterium sp.]